MAATIGIHGLSTIDSSNERQVFHMIRFDSTDTERHVS
jgi:hypothetical protein